MKATTSYLIAASLMLSLCSNAADKVTVTVANTTKTARELPEMASVSANDICQRLGTTIDNISSQLIVCNASGDTLPSQLTYDGQLIFPISTTIPAKGKMQFTVSASATPVKSAPKKVFGRLYPERQMDFSFENDRIAYRIYGPDTQKRGERLYGYDIFNKRTDKLILDKFYALQCDNQMWHTVNELKKQGHRELADDVYNYGFCYHVDRGEGMDCYKVGSTLGAGTNALIDAQGENITYPWCFKQAEILDNGPLRLTVRLTYADEERILSLDAGSNMVRADITHNKELGENLFCAGMAIHKESPEEYITGNGYAVCSDSGDPDMYAKKYRAKQDPAKGHIYIGVIIPGATRSAYIPFKKETSGAVGQAIVIGTNASKQTYYFGNAWDKNTAVGITDLKLWEQYVKNYQQQVNNPLKYTVK